MVEESRSSPAGGSPCPARLAYRIPEVIAATGFSRTTLYRDISTGKLVARKRGSATIVLAEDLQNYLAGLPAMQSKGRS